MDIRVVTADEFGAACLAALLEGVQDVERPVVGLPTGNTPVALFEALKAAVASGEASISRWRPFAIDEYGGPRNHPCSNWAFFRRYWDVIPGAQPVEQFDPEAADLDAECARMAGALESAGGLDVALLGVGLNGHLAFNEPGSRRDSTVRRMELHRDSRESARPCWGADAPTWGLTLGLRELLSARTVIVMANGQAKADIVAAAIQGLETDDCPASIVRSCHRPVWVLDEGAASGRRKG